jgi:hypothetical protein
MRVFVSGSLAVLSSLLLAACSSGEDGEETYSGVHCSPPSNSGGEAFSDPHRNGRSSELQIAEISWGRLVDVHRLAVDGAVDPDPLWRDLVIHERVGSDGNRWRLETTVTGRERLVLLTRDRTEAMERAREASAELPGVEGVGTLPSESLSFGSLSIVPRNATLVVRFDDLLDDGEEAVRGLSEAVRLVTGPAGETDLPARVLFDPNHGGVRDGVFHSTRILVDPTISGFEAEDSETLGPVHPLGLPAGRGAGADALLRLAGRIDLGSGRAGVLSGLDGAPLAAGANDRIDGALFRAFRTGAEEDLYRGYLHDDTPPEVIGAWPTTIDAAVDDPAGLPGRDFLIDASFPTACQAAPQLEEVFLAAQTRFLEVTSPGHFDPTTGTVTGLGVHLLNHHPTTAPDLLGHARHLIPFDPAIPVERGCWIGLRPHPREVPLDEVSPDACVIVRFSEPIARRSVRPFDSFRLVRGDSSTTPTATDLVIGEITSSRHHREFTFHPALPFAHAGAADPYHVDLRGGPDGIVDLAGNPLALPLPPVDFTIDPTAAVEENGGIVLRFADTDEYQVGAAAGADDLRGQFVPDFGAETIRARPVARFSSSADRSNLVPSVMIPFPPGVKTPLSPMGSKLQTVWRYADFGWAVLDEVYMNLDVEGLNWSPAGVQVAADYFPGFEIRLSHSTQLPDEGLDNYLLPRFPTSGLYDSPHPFDDNILGTPADQKVVHHRSLGYVVNPVDLFLSSTGTFLMPYPLNRVGGERETYTWRDTAVLDEAGYQGAGIPTKIEENLGLAGPAGSIAIPGDVPSIGLPLLMEYRCYPTDSALGLNAFDVSLAVNSSARPNFRAFSTGGFNQSGQAVAKDPDLELVPSGGFNPNSTPPGAPTRSAENTFYLGQVDFVVRVNRIHSVWLDSAADAPGFLPPVIEALGGSLPPGCEVQVEFRAAHAFIGDGLAPFDAALLDAYGDPPPTTEVVYAGDGTWTDEVSALRPARYVQLRITLLGDIDTLEVPEISTLALAFTR